MIDNPNPRNFYSLEEMKSRENFIPELKVRLLDKINDLRLKIENEEPFPHGNMDLEFLSETDDVIESILSNWSY